MLGPGPAEIVLAPPHTVLKTSSGKIRRSAVRELFESGALRRGAGSVRMQVARLALAAARGTARSWALRAARVVYAFHAGVVVGATFAVAWLAVVVVPGSRHARWRRGRSLARTALGALGIRLRVSGAAHLEGAGPYVLVVNHTSYLDGPVLFAALPAPIGYVVKGELEGNRILAPLLRALGAEFVHRLDHGRSVADVELLTSRLTCGDSLGFFPEGTLHRMPGLLPFRLGAFSVAAAGEAGVVPVTIVGSRSALRDGQWVPRPGTISVRVGSPIEPADRPSGASSGERDRASRPPRGGNAPADAGSTAPGSADAASGTGRDEHPGDVSSRRRPDAKDPSGGAPVGARMGRRPVGRRDAAPAAIPAHQGRRPHAKDPSGGAPVDARMWRRAVRLRDAARAVILAHCGEPDLGARHDVLDTLRRRKREEGFE